MNKILILLEDRYLSTSKQNNYFVKVCSVLWDTVFINLTQEERALAIQLMLIANIQKSKIIEVDLQNLADKCSKNASQLERLRILTEQLRTLKANKIAKIVRHKLEIEIEIEKEIDIDCKDPHGSESDLFLNSQDPLTPPLEIPASSKTMREKKQKSWDFDAIYQIYPNKVGKSPGFKKLQKIVKDQKTFDEILNGVKNYANDCKNKETEKKFIKSFQNFVRDEIWHDFQNPILNEDEIRDETIKKVWAKQIQQEEQYRLEELGEKENGHKS